LIPGKEVGKTQQKKVDPMKRRRRGAKTLKGLRTRRYRMKKIFSLVLAIGVFFALAEIGFA